MNVKLIDRLFAPRYLVRSDMLCGELPSAREAYGTALRLAWPSAIESVLIALIASIDTMMVGQIGTSAISAVGITTQPKFILLALVITLNIGVTAIVARRRGEGDIEGANRCLKQALVLSASLGVAMTAIALLFAEELVLFAGAKADYYQDATAYFKLMMSTTAFNTCAMTLNAAQRGFGNTRTSMITNVTANLCNVLLNWLLINGIWFFPRLGVRGAAIATAASSVVAFAIALRSVLTHAPGRLSLIQERSWRFDRRTVSGMVKVGSSALVEQVFLRVGFFIYALLAANLGTVEFATHQVCMSLIHISFAFGDGFAVASTSLVGRGLGEKRPDKSMMYGKVGQRCALIMGLLLALVFVLLRYQLLGLFTDESAVLELGGNIVFIIAATCIVQTSQVVISGCLRGAGDSKFVAVSSFICVGVIRTALSWFLCYPCALGLVGMWLGLFSDQLLRLVLNFVRFRSAKWTKVEL
ncbi:MAG: MATE family efflux transporter [Clostridia bacterium]|nr:MATE family efflux transporter [Clostridia bacterium]